MVESFDFVIALENVDQELTFVLSQLLSKETMEQLPPLQPPKDKQSISKLYNYLQEVDPFLVLEVIKKYEKDFEMFGYEMPRSVNDIELLIQSKIKWKWMETIFGNETVEGLKWIHIHSIIIRLN